MKQYLTYVLTKRGLRNLSCLNLRGLRESDHRIFVNLVLLSVFNMLRVKMFRKSSIKSREAYLFSALKKRGFITERSLFQIVSFNKFGKSLF